MQRPHQRLNNFHGAKRNVIGNGSAHVPPAWRAANGAMNGVVQTRPSEGGSKIFCSMLPNDVREREVDELFSKTVGPLRDSFIVYNSQGNSKGMAVVHFQRAEDAQRARQKYDGRVVDGRRPLRIQVILDGDEAPTQPTRPPTLFERMEGFNTDRNPVAGPSRGQAAPQALRFATLPQARHEHYAPPRPATPYNAAFNNSLLARAQNPAHKYFPVAARGNGHRVKKGPKRLKKQWAVANGVAAGGGPFVFAARKAMTKDDLDREMEDYRAQADAQEEEQG
ncbi:RNA annealing protein [Mycena kentingensis (nom. inval.)]|nr:RNA annealing protein [Mycena kentingensis (nom. inval.)]